MTTLTNQPDLSHADLMAAVAAGIIEPEQASKIMEFSISRAQSTGQADEENFRLISSFNDIFVTIGLGLFIGALIWLTAGLGDSVQATIIAVVAWGLAEIFTRRKRLALPSIVTLIVFAVAVFMAASSFSSLMIEKAYGISWSPEKLWEDFSSISMVIAGLITGAATYVHWLRFHVPVTIAAGFSAAAVVVVGAIHGQFPEAINQQPILVFLPLGLAAFALAMRIDISDRARQTRRTDMAFWLHLLAAPLIVHPVVSNFVMLDDMTMANAGMVLALFLGLSVVAVIVDRRALLVSSLSYLAYAAITLISTTSFAPSAYALAILAVGAVVLLLSVAWQPLRAVLLRLLPETIRHNVPAAARN